MDRAGTGHRASMTSARVVLSLLLLWLSLVALGCGRVHVGTQDGGPSTSDATVPPTDGGGVTCGPVTCAPGLVCCNESCGICTAPGGGCIQVACSRACATSADCGASEYCAHEGGCSPGCTSPGGCPPDGVCVPRAEDCPAVIDEVCGCDGVTYSNGCDAAAQGIDVASRGPCAPRPGCAPEDAAGVGPCDAIVGARWNGARCESLSGCSCEGADCEAVGARDVEGCERVHAGCASCAPMDAVAVGDCPAFFGYAWDGSACVGINGCACEGADCPAAYDDPAVCELAHAHCASGGACLSSADCAPEQYCAWAPGECGGSGDPSGTCQPVPPPSACSFEAPPVCGCDGVTYGCAADAAASGASVLHDGPCSGGGGCAPTDAAGEGPCAAFFGYRWDGARCEGVSGCSCVGSDCERLYESPDACEAARAECARAPGGDCGGIGGGRCRPDEWCDYEDPHTCGADDQLGRCRPRPDVCDLVLSPACGCDGVTYDNACFGWANGVDSRPGAC